MFGFPEVDPLKPFFPSDQIFSGLNEEYHKFLLDEIYLLVKHGQFTYSDIYMMPTYQRKYFIDKMIESKGE
jgi:hypothetical protein